MSRKRRPKTKDLEKEDHLENEDLENEDPLENEDLENEEPLEKHENTKQKIEVESSLAYLQISKIYGRNMALRFTRFITSTGSLLR